MYCRLCLVSLHQGIKLGNTPKEYTVQREEYKSFMLVAGIGMVINIVLTSMIGIQACELKAVR